MNKTIIAATLMTIAWLVFWSSFVYLTWNTSKDMALNEWGDFLAGTFSPLAFMWLVLGYFQQGRELSQNTEMLRLQAAELRNSVEQQTQLVQVTKEELHLNKTQQDELCRKEKMKSQPKFVAEGEYFSYKSDLGVCFSFKLINKGHKISNITATSTNKDVRIKTSYFNHWDSGEEKNIEIDHKTMRNFYPNIDLIIDFEFFDGLNEISSSTTTLFLKKNGYVTTKS